MNNKVKQVLVLLFVVSTLLIMIGSVSANTDNLNENLEASDTLNVDLSAVPEADSAADEDVSNQLTISNIDEQTNGSSQSDLGESASANVVSSNEDTTIDAKDSANNNIIKASNEGDDVLTDSSSFIITNTALNPYAKVGDIVTFHVFGRNVGGDFDGNPLEIGFDYNKDQLDFVSFTPGINSEAPPGYDAIAHYNLGSSPNPNFDMNPKGLLVGYDCSDYKFANGFLFNFTLSFRVKTPGTLETTAFMWHAPNARSTAQTNVADFTITNTALNPYAKVGDEVQFEIYVENIGGTYDGMYDSQAGHFVGLNFIYDSSKLEYIGYTPAVYAGNYLEPRVYPNQNLAQFGYKIWDEGFKNGYNFNFTVNFRVKNPGTMKTTASVIGFDSATSTNQTDVADFRITVTPSDTTVILNKGDEINFNIFVINVGGAFYPDPYEGYRFVGINFRYNSNVLNYTGYTPCETKYGGRYEENYLVPKINPSENLAQFAYIVHDEGFLNEYNFNFTVTFKVLEYGTSQNSISITQYPNVSKGVTVNARPTDITITSTPTQKTLKVGDDVGFHYLVKNEGAKYGDDYISIEIDFDSDKLKFGGYSSGYDLDLESITYTSAHDATGSLLGASDGDVLGADSSVGHLKFGFNSPGGFDAGSSFTFDGRFNSVTDGKLQSSATVSANNLEDKKVYAAAYAGDPSLKLSKTPDRDFANVGDYIHYTIYLENNGTLHFTDKDYIQFDDYYLPGLAFVGYDIEGLEDHISEADIINVNDTKNGGGHVSVKYYLLDEDGFAPGSSFSYQLIFKVISPGIRCNYIFCEMNTKWSTSDLASVPVEEPEINLTKRCLNSSVELNDLVYYEIYVENTGNISYFDHENAYGVQYLIIEDIYPEGLEYQNEYILNPDKNGYTWTDNIESVEDVDGRVVIKYKTWEGWEPGSTINITLIFKAVNYGKLVNKAHIYWNWKDWGPKESQKEIELDDEAETVVGPATFSIEKISNYKVAKVGDIVSFSIVYTNTGNKTITGAYIIDSKYSKGLEYYDYSNKEDWTYIKDENKWIYNGELEGGQSATLELLFKALTIGQKSNTAVAGHSGSNETLEDTDTVLIKEGVNGTAKTEGKGVAPIKPDDDPDEPPYKEHKEEPKDESVGESYRPSESVAAESTMHAAGNPLFVLLMSLLTLCFVERKGKK